MFGLQHGARPHDIGWFDGTAADGMSIDGAVVAFSEVLGTGENRDGYPVYVRRGDAAPVVVAHGRAAALLPDGSGVIVASVEQGALLRVPTGAGATTALPRGDVDRIDFYTSLAVSWNGRWLVFRGAVAGGRMRLWLQDLEGGPPRAIGPDAMRGGTHPISPDGAWVASADPGGVRLLSTAGAADRILPGAAGEQPISFTADGSALFVLDGGSFPRQLRRVEVATGRRTPWDTLVGTAEDDTTYAPVALDGDGQHLAYSISTTQSDLYVVEPPTPAPAIR
jgi:hypothetical protein